MDTTDPDFLLLIDLRDSTRLPGDKSKAVFDRIEDEVRRCNKRWRRRLAVRLRISYGDEVAGLFLEPAPAYEVALSIRDLLRDAGVGMRFVIAEGRIANPSNDIRKVGGPVFRAASEAMAELKRTNRPCVFRFEDPRLSRMLTRLAELSQILVGEMTAYQHRVYRLLKQSMLQKDIASRLDKSEQSVSTAKINAYAEEVIDSENLIRDILSEHVTSGP